MAVLRPSTSFFIVSEQDEETTDKKTWLRRNVTIVLRSRWFEAGIAAVILFNFLLICMETDSRALRPQTLPTMFPTEVRSFWVARMMDLCYAIFVLELLVRVFADQAAFAIDAWNCMDGLVILAGTLECILQGVGAQFPGEGVIRILRLLRMLRLLRVLRLFFILKEIRRLLDMMGSCLKTLFWSFLLLLLVESVWAVIAVEVLNPIVQQVADAGGFDDNCERCSRSFASTYMANLTFFQTILAGDSWGQVAVPIMEAYPWQGGSVLMGALLTLGFGLVNLIMAVVVDTFAEKRDSDVVGRAVDLENQEVEEKRVLAKIFQKIDADANGVVSFEQLQQGARKVAEFRQWLRVMDIDSRDLRQLFTIVDEDSNGKIDPNEFIEAMYRIKHTESKTATKFVKHMITKMESQQQDLRSHVSSNLSKLEAAMEKGLTERETTLQAERSRMEKVVVQSGEHWVKAEEDLKQKLADQEKKIQHAVEVAISKASEVALEAALQAASMAARNVMATVGAQHHCFLAGVHKRLELEREVDPSCEVCQEDGSPQRVSTSEAGSNEPCVATWSGGATMIGKTDGTDPVAGGVGALADTNSPASAISLDLTREASDSQPPPSSGVDARET